MTLYECLQEVYKNYRYYKVELKSITLKCLDSMEKIKSIMSNFRKENIEQIVDIKVEELQDYKK